MYDIIVVGGGPAGLTAALYAARAGKTVAVAERENTGGQIVYSPLVENYPAVPALSGADFAQKLTEQVEALGVEILYDEVTGLSRDGEGFAVQCTSGEQRCKAVVLATGKQDFVTDGEQVVLIENGTAALSGITGTGCMVGALTAAFLPGCEDHIAKEMTDRTEAGVWSGSEMGLNGRSGNYLDAAVLGTALMGIAGEQAEKISRGPGSFQVNLLDEIYGISDRQLLGMLKIEMY